MNDFEDFEFRCYRCRSQMACIQQCYSITRTFEQSHTCDCADGAELAGLFRYSLTEVWEESGDLEEGRFIRDGRLLVDRLPKDILERQIHCQDCCDTAAELDWETEEVDEAEIIEGPEAWRLSCKGCRREIRFGWTGPNRSGLIVPLPTRNYDVSQLWVDPGFRVRKQIRSQQRKARVPEGIRLIRPAIKKAGRGDGAKGLD